MKNLEKCLVHRKHYIGVLEILGWGGNNSGSMVSLLVFQSRPTLTV